MPEKKLSEIKEGQVQILLKSGNNSPSCHQWSERERDALILAVASRRPLLVRGEPGTGKTQLARATSEWLGWSIESVTINSRFEPLDLIYTFDPIKRLADAQLHNSGSEVLAKNAAEYWEPGPLWKSYDWESASRYGALRNCADRPNGFVILIDEIDKTDSDLPNSLLEVLGQRSFSVPGINLRIDGSTGNHPLVIITTNEERELPPAFLRRCIVLTLDSDNESYSDWLVKRGRAHFGLRAQEQFNEPDRLIEDEILILAAQQLSIDRRETLAAGLAPPGLAEYLDLLSALRVVAPLNTPLQRSWLKRLNSYAYLKHGAIQGHSNLSQRRPTI